MNRADVEGDGPRDATYRYAWQDVDADSIKKANRRVRQQVPDDQVASLYAMRDALVSKKFESQLDDEEERELQLLRWEIDAVEDALYGEELDKLERLADLQQAFAQDLRVFVKQFSPPKKK